MSVPTHKRKPNKIEFIDTAHELVVHTLRYTNKKFAKKHVDTVRMLRNLALAILENVTIGNSIYVVTAEDKRLRRQYMQLARSKCYALNTLLSVMHDPGLVENKITDYGWRKWGDLLRKEINLLSGVIKTDSKKQTTN